MDDKELAEQQQRDHMADTSHSRFWEHSRYPTIVTAPPLVASRITRRERASR
ncbi:hypothetical protein I5Q34_03780 [Streptomyces sp. AV19]|uniref:hypothetical protein n=1 Tax=Streptomyces sp. AV19 TaxID=2793068 RepID=UPI0018FE28CB|nr:hypothetical protein [Streptomyces sp. AV19]MBH1933414.1 hypothetical protein [Streptomyces sp. AV19]MDG4532045.1 hypothetical protein [Streptomyces sp. AV19]